MDHFDTGVSADPNQLLPPDIALDAQGRLADEIPCRVCGYNLRSADPNGTCPECGTAVGWSVVGDFLRYSAPQWMRQVASGANFYVAGIAVTILTLLFLIVAFVGLPQDAAVLLFSGGMIVGAILMAIGVWKLTTPEPSKIEETGMNVRMLTRYTMVTNSALFIVSIGLNLGDAVIVAAVLDIAGSLVAIVGFFALFTFLRQLALRVPDDNLASQTRTVMWGLVIGYGAMFLGELFALANVGAGELFACVAGPLLLVFGIWSLLLFDRYRRCLNQAAAQAEATWASHSQPG